MQRILILAALGAIALTETTAPAGDAPRDILQTLRTDPSASVSTAEIERLRQQGQAALDALSAQRTALVEQRDRTTNEATRILLIKNIERHDAVIDQVGGARYCSLSGLFWHVDLDAAKAVAAQSGKPILSLRMLGKLTDEYSCANSRFFRTTLYANREVSEFLRTHYILHWQTVRPVPRITVDFGDGRRIERTITGNSAHYVLTPDGQPLDVLPGLYGPQAFLEWLMRSKQFAASFDVAAPSQRNAVLRSYHSRCRRSVAMRWQQDLLLVAPELVADTTTGSSRQHSTDAVSAGVSAAAPSQAAGTQAAAAAVPAPPARAAAMLAKSKSTVEIPLLRALTTDTPQLEKRIDEAAWNKIAALHAGDARLDEAARDVIRRENPDAEAAALLAITKRKVESPLMRMVRNLESAIALDTVRNEYLLHRRVHEWFAAGEVPADVQPLNERVYAELFLTPSSDPWLGLVPPDTYTALERGGLVKSQAPGR